MSNPEDYSEDFEIEAAEEEEEASQQQSQSEQLSQSTSVFSQVSEVDKSTADKQEKDEVSEGVPDELKGLTRYFEGAGDEGDDQSASISISVSKSQDYSNSAEHESIENIMEKLNRLANAQQAIENVLEAEGNMDEVALQAALSKARLQIPAKNDNKEPIVAAEEEEELSLSLSAEMDALKKLTGKRDYDEDSEAAGSSGRMKERDVQQIFKQYDELEKSLARSRYASCDEQDSIRSEVSQKSRTREPMKTQQSSSSSPFVMTQPSNFDRFVTQPSNSKSKSTTNVPIPDFFSQSNSLSSSSSLTMTDGLETKPKERPSYQPPPTSSSQQQESYYNTKPIVQLCTKQTPRSEKSKSIEIPPTTSPVKFSSNNYIKESLSAHSQVLARDRPITPSSPKNNNTARSSRTISSPKRTGSQQVRSSRNGGGGEGFNLQEEYFEKIQKLEKEIARQETLIDAFQQDNQKLYNELKEKEKEHSKKETEWEEIANSLKTEVATLKISRLTNSPARPGSAHKAELERVRQESEIKSQQISELRREIIGIRNAKVETPKPAAAKQGKAIIVAQEREKESQKTIRSLNKQVRTLQKILYRRDPVAASALARASSRDDLYMSQDKLSTGDDGNNNEAHVTVLENRIVELERDLGQADEDARNRLKDFQARFNGLKGKYEDQIKDYEMKLYEAAGRIEALESHASQATIQDFKNRLDKSQAEVGHLKQEINRYKRELEIAQKSSVSTAVSQATAKQDAGTLSLAIKSFKSELAEKEKEIIRMKKEVADLNRTNNTLKREREKYLNLANALSLPGSVPSSNSRIVTRVQAADVNEQGLKLTREKGNPSSKPKSPTRGTTNANLATTQMLQSAMEYERSEFQQMIDLKKKELQERDQIIVKLKREIEELRDGKEEDQVDDSSKSHMLNELRSRVTTQNELIHKLKDHIANYRRIEGDYLLLKQENEQAEVQKKALKQELELAKLKARPETEVLDILMSKLDDLNSRYLQREIQINGLLRRLMARTGSNYLSPRMTLSSSGGSNNLEEEFRKSELDLRQLSPTLAIQLLNTNTSSSDGFSQEI